MVCVKPYRVLETLQNGGAEAVKWPESLVQAALCAVADTLGFSKAKNVGKEHLLKALEKLSATTP